jgi:hypothetical protein
MREAGIPEVEIQQKVFGVDELQARRNLEEDVRESERGIGPGTQTAVFQAKAQAAAAAELASTNGQEPAGQTDAEGTE